jgi:hypothetical protein
MKLDAIGPYNMINQKEFWAKTKSWKFTDCELKANNEYTIVIKISKEITWTKALAVAIIAYLDCDNKPTTVKNMFPNNISIRWYRIIESTPSNINIEGPHIKVWENNS